MDIRTGENWFKRPDFKIDFFSPAQKVNNEMLHDVTVIIIIIMMAGVCRDVGSQECHSGDSSLDSVATVKYPDDPHFLLDVEH